MAQRVESTYSAKCTKQHVLDEGRGGWARQIVNKSLKILRGRKKKIYFVDVGALLELKFKFK